MGSEMCIRDRPRGLSAPAVISSICKKIQALIQHHPLFFNNGNDTGLKKSAQILSEDGKERSFKHGTMTISPYIVPHGWENCAHGQNHPDVTSRICQM